MRAVVGAGQSIFPDDVLGDDRVVVGIVSVSEFVRHGDQRLDDFPVEVPRVGNTLRQRVERLAVSCVLGELNDHAAVRAFRNSSIVGLDVALDRIEQACVGDDVAQQREIKCALHARELRR